MTTTPRRFKLVVAYDGGPFAGWQSQVHGNTIQDHLERAIRKVSGENARVHGSGRTDTGVHALEQCAHFDLGKRGLDSSELQKALNATLPANHSGFALLSCFAKVSCAIFREVKGLSLPDLEWAGLAAARARSSLAPNEAARHSAHEIGAGKVRWSSRFRRVLGQPR